MTIAAFGLLLAAPVEPAAAHSIKPESSKVEARPARPGEFPAPATLGGPWSLVDHTGKAVTRETYRGRWQLMFFGFSNCGETCPIALNTMAAALDVLGEDAGRIQPLFVDFDTVHASPERRELLTQFVGRFHPRLVGLTGTRKQIYDIVRMYRVRREHMVMNYSKKEGQDHRLDHTTYFYLVDPEGATRAYFYHDMPPERMAAAIRQHM